jgi:hypothetical protein
LEKSAAAMEKAPAATAEGAAEADPGPATAEQVKKAIADFKFDFVALAVIKTNGFHLRKTIQSPGEAGCRILPSAEKDERFFLGHAV